LAGVIFCWLIILLRLGGFYVKIEEIYIDGIGCQEIVLLDGNLICQLAKWNRKYADQSHLQYGTENS